MRDGYQKSLLIVLLGFSYIGATYAVTGFFIKENKEKPITNYQECFWSDLDKHDFLVLDENKRERLVVNLLNACNKRFPE